MKKSGNFTFASSFDYKMGTRRVGKADYTYSEEGALTMTQYRTATGEKTTCSQGYSAVSQEWDAEGRLTHRMYLDEEGNGVNNRDGVSEERYEYDGEGMLRAVRRYDAGGTQIQ